MIEQMLVISNAKLHLVPMY